MTPQLPVAPRPDLRPPGIEADERTTLLANEVILTCTDLDTPGARSLRETVPPSMRWLLVHMLEETARHVGHADILREQTDGAVGR
ncbi:mycothiol transferase [Kitasatospora azatica]|uniref:mycothiol transferase n=1 Tax=Kitasatospora azatica TaxID=58347 RepID=UPI00056C530C|nr:DUF664 domain-containing protein [Kitasatospora azatica]